MIKRALFWTWRQLAQLARPSRKANLRRLRQRGEEPSSIRIRAAEAEDIPALSRLHVTAWNATYRPLLVKGPGVEVRERQWREAFARHAQDPCCFCLVLQRPDGQLVGFVQARRSDHPDFGGELNKIYILPEYQRMGLGRRLLSEVARRLRSQGINSMWLCGDPRNPSSRAWIAMGAEKTDADPGTGNYGWQDLKGLAEHIEQ